MRPRTRSTAPFTAWISRAVLWSQCVLQLGCTRFGRNRLTPEARAELELAARLCANQRERSVLLRKAAALG